MKHTEAYVGYENQRRLHRKTILNFCKEMVFVLVAP